MSALAEEVRHVQNPALGSLVLWSFVRGYTNAKGDGTGCPLPLLFTVLPIVLHAETLVHVKSTQVGSGLRGFAAKFSKVPESGKDLLLSVHERALILRPLSLESLQIAAHARLLSVDSERAEVYSLTTTFPQLGISGTVRALSKDAEKVGRWCAALTLVEVSSVLQVRF